MFDTIVNMPFRKIYFQFNYLPPNSSQVFLLQEGRNICSLFDSLNAKVVII